MIVSGLTRVGFAEEVTFQPRRGGGKGMRREASGDECSRRREQRVYRP